MMLKAVLIALGVLAVPLVLLVWRARPRPRRRVAGAAVRKGRHAKGNDEQAWIDDIEDIHAMFDK